MKISRLASALTLSLLTATSAYAAKYRVVELPLRDTGVNSFAVALNDKGEVATTVQSPFRPPIDIDLIDFDSDFLTVNLTDLGAASVGNINDEDLLTLYSYILNGSSSQFFQQIANIQSYIVNEAEAEGLKAFDVIDSDLEGLTKSADTQVYGINNASATVGVSEAPFYKVDYRNENGDNLTYVAQDHSNRGFLEISAQAYPIVPEEDRLGGFSEARDINNSFEVAGWASVDIANSFDLAIDNCDDENERGDVPYESCIRTLLENYKNVVFQNAGTGRKPIDTAFKRRAMIWQFNAQGDLISSRELGTLVPTIVGDETFYTSRANAINENGIAVGISNAFYLDVEGNIADYAAIFDGDEVIGFTDQQNYFQSEAVDINDNDIVIGNALTQINGSIRTKFFVHDYRGEFTTYPDDFFNSSSSFARGINNNGLVVGEGEIDSDFSSQRRKEGFLYDINTDEFLNINDLLACDSPYTIVQGNAINDNDEIAATATIFRERSNITGELDLDERGNTIFSNVTVAVKLIPIPGGSVDDCSLTTPQLTRKGGSAVWLSLLLLLGLGLRQKRAN